MALINKQIGGKKMKKSLLAGLALGLWMISTVGMAEATVIDFESAPTGSFNHLVIGEYQFDWILGDQQKVVNVWGSNVLGDNDLDNWLGAEVIMSRLDGGMFDVHSLDLGHTEGNQSDFRIDIGGVSYYPGQGLTTISPNLTGITGLNINIVDRHSGYFVDNINVTSAPVPEPATMLLMGTGLTGLIAARRKKKA